MSLELIVLVYHKLLACDFQVWTAKQEANGKLPGPFCSGVNLRHCVPVNLPCFRFQEGYDVVCFLLEMVRGGELKLLRVLKGKSMKGRSLLPPCGRGLPLELQFWFLSSR